MLGILEDGDWEDEKIQLSDRSRIALSTDGITETFNLLENDFGKQRLLELLLKHASKSATETAELIHSSVTEFRGNAKQTDDVTLLLLDLVLKSDSACRSDSRPEDKRQNGHHVHVANHKVVLEQDPDAAG